MSAPKRGMPYGIEFFGRLLSAQKILTWSLGMMCRQMVVKMPNLKLNPRFLISINRAWPGEKLGLPPAERRWAKYNGSFIAEDHEPVTLLGQITQGFSFTAVLGGCQGVCCGTWCTNPTHKKTPDHCGRPRGYRRNQHFVSAQFIALDFDTGDERSTINFLARNPLIARYVSFLYTTLSHTPEIPKARAVFVFDSAVTDPNLYRRFKRAVMAKLPWGDASVHDPARMFYGSHPQSGHSVSLGNLLPLAVAEDLMEEHRAELEAEQPRRNLPRVASARVFGATPAERYANTAVQKEVTRVSSQVEGTGERHKGLLISSMKLASLGLSDWLPAAIREGIDPYALLLPAAEANGYVAKYGEAHARQTIADGAAYARPRPNPDTQKSTNPMLRWSGGQWVKAVQV